MSRLSLAFFTTGALCVLGGMIWGVVMAASNDHTMMPAHAHLNLMGWATLALMGTFYALSGRSDRLGWANYWISTLSVVVSIPALAMLLAATPPPRRRHRQGPYAGDPGHADLPGVGGGALASAQGRLTHQALHRGS